jgi:hypothetical protein
MQMNPALEQFKTDWPAVFAGVELDKMTGGGFRWRTLQNLKSTGEAPNDIFLRSGSHKLLVVRDPFLDWWQSRITKG